MYRNPIFSTWLIAVKKFLCFSNIFFFLVSELTHSSQLVNSEKYSANRHDNTEEKKNSSTTIFLVILLRWLTTMMMMMMMKIIKIKKLSSPWNSFKLNLININLPRLPVHYPHFSSSISSMEFSLKCHSMYAYGDDWIINNYLISISISSWASALRTCIISLWKFLVVCRWRRWWCELQYIFINFTTLPQCETN